MENLIEELAEQDIQGNDIEFVHKVYTTNFSPTFNFIRTLQCAVSGNMLDQSVYQKSLSEYVRLYNDRFDKNIDSSYVENKLRDESKKDDEDVYIEDNFKDYMSNNSITLSKLNRP